MKLISCHIENYGNLHKIKVEFDEHITSFYRENGTGKSTLASFIKAMFYGLESYTSLTKAFVDRKHYYPFNEQLFGGNITFIHNDKTYRIERFFSKKSDVADSFKLYCDGSISHDFSENIGNEIFGIDKNSFERLLFIDYNDIEISSTSSINLKLNNILDGNDITDLDRIFKTLDENAKPFKDYKSEKSLVYKTKEKIKKLKSQINNKLETKSALKNHYNRLNELDNEIDKLEQQEKKCHEINAKKASQKHYKDILNDLDDKIQKCQKLNVKYPNGFPNDNQINGVFILLRSLQTIEEKIKNQSLDEQELLTLNNNKKIFKDNIVENDLAIINENIKQYKENINEINYLNSFHISSKDEEILNIFSNNNPSKNDLDNLKQNISDYLFFKNNDCKSDKKPIYLAFLVLFIVLTILSSLLFFKNIVAAIISLCLSFSCFIICLFLVFKENKSGNVKYTNKLKELKITIENYLAKYNYFNKNDDLLFKYNNFKSDLEKYYDLENVKNSNINKIKNIEKEQDNIVDILNSLFLKYQVKTNDYEMAFLDLSRQYDEYLKLTKRYENKEKEKEVLIKELKTINDEIVSFCIKYNLDASMLDNKLNELIRDRHDYDNCLEEIKELKNKTKEFDLSNISIIEQDDNIVLEDLQNKINQLKNQRSQLNSSINEAEFELSTLDENISECEHEEELLKAYQEKYNIYLLTINSLKQAEQNLKDKYIGPIKEKFSEYASILENSLNEEISMDNNYEISFERNGKLRSNKHLSSGNKSICALCFRLALIANMYQDNAVFAIMDDPFVNLDENHLIKVKEVINELSKNIQIIYLTCHKSRELDNN